MMAENTTVLVAEDDVPSRTIMVRLLERSDYRVLAASDGVEAMQMMSAEVGVAVLDWMLPGLDGLALCRLHVRVDGHGQDREVGHGRGVGRGG